MILRSHFPFPHDSPQRLHPFRCAHRTTTTPPRHAATISSPTCVACSYSCLLHTPTSIGQVACSLGVPLAPCASGMHLPLLVRSLRAPSLHHSLLSPACRTRHLCWSGRSLSRASSWWCLRVVACRWLPPRGQNRLALASSPMLQILVSSVLDVLKVRCKSRKRCCIGSKYFRGMLQVL
jgi:hypothetical protein